MTPANERKAKERKAKRDAGLVRVEVWVPQGMQAFAKSFVEAVCRENVGGPPKTAIEIVAIENTERALRRFASQTPSADTQLVTGKAWWFDHRKYGHQK